MKKSNFCPIHTRELMRHFCTTCVQLICMECIVDHSGHEFVRKEESSKSISCSLILHCFNFTIWFSLHIEGKW